MKIPTRFERSVLAMYPREQHAAIRARWEENDRRQARFTEAVHAVGNHIGECRRCLDSMPVRNAPAPDCPEATRLLKLTRAASAQEEEDVSAD